MIHAIKQSVEHIGGAIESNRLAVRKRWDDLTMQLFGPKTIASSPIERGIWYFFLGVTVFVALFPVYWMTISSLIPTARLMQLPPLVTPSISDLTLGNYAIIFGDPLFNFGRHVINSFLVAIIVATVSVIVAIFGGYSLARMTYPGKGIFARGVLVVYMFSGILLVIPLFQLASTLGLTNSLYGLMITYLVFTLPLSLYLLGNFFRGVDPSVEEAAMIDGYSRFEIVLYIIIPMSKSAILAVWLFAFLIGWSEYLFATVFIRDTALFTIPISIDHMLDQYAQIWGQVMAAAVIACIPVFAIFMFLEKYMVEGLELG